MFHVAWSNIPEFSREQLISGIGSMNINRYFSDFKIYQIIDLMNKILQTDYNFFLNDIFNSIVLIFFLRLRLLDDSFVDTTFL